MGDHTSEPANADECAAQVAREREAVDVALGRRHARISGGDLSPVLRRWVSATIGPVSARLRQAAEAYASGDDEAFTEAVSSPTFGLVRATRNVHSLGRLLGHLLEGNSPGRGAGTTYAEDVVLAVVATAVTATATNYADSKLLRTTKLKPGLSAVIGMCANAARTTVQGQLMVSMQGWDSLAKTRIKGRKAWQVQASKDAAAGLLLGQVRDQLISEANGEISLEHVGNRRVLKVIDDRLPGEQSRLRKITLRPPTEDQWKVFDMARMRHNSEMDPYSSEWLSLATMILCCTQAEFGWFEIGGDNVKMKGGRTVRRRWLMLTEDATRLITRDVDKWLALGFSHRPMIIPPPDGDYLTVKHREVSTRYAPMGNRTDAAGTLHHDRLVDTISHTAWQINGSWLNAIKHGSWDDPRDKFILAEHSRELASAKLYFPIFLDFRGRCYLRTPWINYQGGDLQRSLLHFHESAFSSVARTVMSEEHETIYARHFAGRYGHGMDKESLATQLEWFRDILTEALQDPSAYSMKAEECFTFEAHLRMYANPSLRPMIPIQLDGTCNGLQHLSAMFCDELGGGYVNLNSDAGDKPSDLYTAVAGDATNKFYDCLSHAKQGAYSDHSGSFLARFSRAGFNAYSRKMAKKPVMTLPYGVTLEGIRENVRETMLAWVAEEAKKAPLIEETWKAAHSRMGPVGADASFASFQDRPLEDHPLFQRDCDSMADILWSAIESRIPKAMQAMEVFRKIGQFAGDEPLSWMTNSQCQSSKTPLWVVQAKPKSAIVTTKTKGLHLPEVARGLTQRMGKDEIDRSYAKTGIVANFIHSHDADHLARTMGKLRGAYHNEPMIGATHDCLMTPCHRVEYIGRQLREAWAEKYSPEAINTSYNGGHPLKLPVKVGDKRYETWHDLAKEAGVEFPTMGGLKPEEVKGNPWFFS